jgi:hypothetical protein|tara:strand:- start:60 stop:923 length:864 start_codon:yes stop_codon:yes gene_type:complete
MAYGVNTGAGISGLTEVDVFIPEVWSSAVFGYLERALKWRDKVDDYSSMITGSGDRIHVPTITEVTVQDKAENTVVQYDATTETKVSLVIDKHKYASKMFEDIGMVQANGSLMAKYAEALGYAMAKQIDGDIATTVTAGVTSGATLGTDDTLTDAEIETALASLGEADLDYRDGNLTFMVNPTLYADLLNNSKFVRYDALGSSKIPSGRLGEMYGIPVEMSNALSTGGTAVSGVIFHKSCTAVAFQQGVRSQAQYDIDYLSTKVVFDAVYGLKTIHATRGYKFTNAS